LNYSRHTFFLRLVLDLLCHPSPSPFSVVQFRAYSTIRITLHEKKIFNLKQNGYHNK
jgi:hypothetical protein